MQSKTTDPPPAPNPPRTWYDDVADAYLTVVAGLTFAAAAALVAALLVALGANGLTVLGVLAGGVAVSVAIRKLICASQQLDQIVVDELHRAVRR